MNIRPFRLERYFAHHEFNAPYLLSCSDCEPLAMAELLAMADAEVRALWDDLRLGYTESQGHPLLRHEIAALYENAGPENVLVLAPEEGIFIAMMALLESGDHVVVTYPGYQSLYEVARAMGCRVTHWLPQETGAGWWFDPQRLEALLTPQTRLLVTNFPHNPTGALPNADEFGAVVNAAARHGMTHFSDEMYRLLEHDPADRLPAAVDLYEGAVSLGGTSKSLAVAGLRIGWLATRNAAWMASFAAYKDYTTICAAAPSEILALAALRARDRIVRRNLDIVAGNLALLDAFFRRHAGQFDWARPRAGTVTFPRLRESGPAEAFCADLLARKGVLLLPGEVYEYTGDGDGGHFRVGYGRVNLPEALAHLDEYLIESHRGV